MTSALRQTHKPWDLTEEEYKHNQYHADKLADAMEAEDEEAESYHLSQIFIDPDTLMSAKILSGAQWIRDRKLNTTLANRKFGHDWLDR